MRRLPDLSAGIYQHYKGHHYLVLGYGRDANDAEREVVVYVGLELDGAKPGPRLSVRTVDDFLADVDPVTGVATAEWSDGLVPRFRYVGPAWTGRPSNLT